MSNKRENWRLCSICKKPIGFETPYHECSVSTCNRKRTQLYFCSVRCWDAHVPTMRHREAWAIEKTSPTVASWEAEQEWERQRSEAKETAAAEKEGSAHRRIVAPAGGTPAAELSDGVEQEILIIASKLKKYIKARSGMRTSDGVMADLSRLVRQAADEAIQRAAEDGRQTVLDRDVPVDWHPV